MVLVSVSERTLFYYISLLTFAGETIRFRVTAETFVETSPSGPENTDIASAGGEASAEEPKVPYMLTVCICYHDTFNNALLPCIV